MKDVLIMAAIVAAGYLVLILWMTGKFDKK